MGTAHNHRIVAGVVGAIVGLLAPVAAGLAAPTPANRALSSAAGVVHAAPVAAGVAGPDLQAAQPKRVVAADPVQLAVDVSQQRFRPNQAAWAVLARKDLFPDSLAATGLLGDGPLLLTASDRLSEASAEELDRLFPNGGRVYVLGGANAISRTVETQLRLQGMDVRRLAGSGRIQTALAIADEIARLNPVTDVFVARAYGSSSNPTAAWADAIGVGAVAAELGAPVVLTPSDHLDPAVEQFIDAFPYADVTLLGGRAALSSGVERALPRATRVAGTSRASTAAAVATRWFHDARATVLVNGYEEIGWASGLISAGVGADEDGPILFVQQEALPSETGAVLDVCRDVPLSLLVVGGPGSVGPEVEQTAQARAQSACQEQSGAYAFMAVNPDGSPVAYDPCAPLRVEVNYAGAPARARTLVRQVISHVEATTGRDIILEADTPERLPSWDSDRVSYVEPGGDSYEPVLVNWPVDWQGTSAWGMGGSASVTGPDGTRTYVSGVISLNPDMPTSGDQLEAVLVHEFGHVLGLAHVNDGDQVMYPYTNEELVRYQSGDRQGLDRLHSSGGFCGSTPRGEDLQEPDGADRQH